MNEKFIFLEDKTDNELFDKRDRGWWVLMKEGEDQNMILFTGLREEIAKEFKQRIDSAISKYIKTL
jgi:hypothetical protein